MTVILIAVIAGVVCLDQLTKWLAVVCLQGEASFPLWKDVLHFTYVENTGMAFGMLKDHRWVFMVFSTIAIVALMVYLFRFRPEGLWMQVSMAMIIGGGIGNMIDRIFLGYVVDFIDFTLINFAVFNVADSFVCVGAGIMILCLVIDLVKEIKQERAQKEAASIARENDNDTDVE
jgi:signal peptidase II